MQLLSGDMAITAPEQQPGQIDPLARGAQAGTAQAAHDPAGFTRDGVVVGQAVGHCGGRRSRLGETTADMWGRITRFDKGL
ncbi:hypothetical protein GCM10011317_09280 [Niveispirillum cyanobacteriorum]|nr:hypothetical protein GCM10011317_09280 [Niveispirillum cyanobacteriorum]